jgi:hypothetical protein
MRRTRLTRTVACAASGVAAVLTMTSTSRADDDAVDARDVLVRGTDAGGFVSRARLEDAPREVTDAASLIEPLPGVHVRRLGADDGFATLSIRGSSSTQVAVYLAGVPLSGGADPMLDLATLPLWPGARARVYRSFAPAGLGRGSLGGTLVLDPPSPRAQVGTEAWASVASFGARRMRVGDVRGEEGGLRLATGVSASRSDNDFDYLDREATFGAGHDVMTTRQNAGHASVAGLVSAALPFRMGPASTGALSVTTLAQARRQELPGANRFPTPFARLSSTRLLSALELSLPTTSANAFRVRAWGRREGFSVYDDPESAKATFSPWRTDDAIVATGGSVGYLANPSDRARVEVRLDGSLERFLPGAWLGSVAPPEAFRTNAGVALDAEKAIADGWTVALSLRGDTWSDRSNNASRAFVKPTGHLGFEGTLGPVVVASHAGVVTRPPSFVELFGNRGAFLGDARLRPESAFTVDAGARTATWLGPVRLRAESSAFATWADDLITFVYVGADGRAKAMNIGRARLFGVESELGASVFGFDLRASYTALATANDSECRYEGAQCIRPPLPGRPAHDFVADLVWSNSDLRLRYGVDVIAGMLADVTEDVEVPTRAIHGAGARVFVPQVRGLSVAFDVMNLFDLRVVEYRGALGPVRAPVGDLFDYPLPGRRAMLSVRFVSEDRREKEERGGVRR